MPKNKSPHNTPPPEAPATPPVPPPCRVVGIGASAGGLAALKAFFLAIPAAPQEVAFVVVQHLAPDHHSILSELIQRFTGMKVFEITDGLTVAPNCTYIIPPNRDLALIDGRLRLLEQIAAGGLRLPIDFFFRSLATDQQERAVGIVLSGTGSDGSRGAEAIQGVGGMVMAQDPASAEYGGMPGSAIATGTVSVVLPAEELPQRLLSHVGGTLGVIPVLNQSGGTTTTELLNRICVLLRAQTGHDFSQYKRNTVARRIERRMTVRQCDTVTLYLTLLQQEPGELDTLFRDLLIGVTSFFRDPEAFEALEAQLAPIFHAKPHGGFFRAWVVGCSTGEEAYSLAMLCAENPQVVGKQLTVQIFATDIDHEAIRKARLGLFPATIAEAIGPERLARHFSSEADGAMYRVKKKVRDLLVFSQQTVIKDPPLSRMDLISCRNLLIYMKPDLQKRLIPLFHYALNTGGLLFLGSSETVGEFATTLFSTQDPIWKIYSRRHDRSGTPGLFATSIEAASPHEPTAASRSYGRQTPSALVVGPFRSLTEQALLSHYVGAAVLVNARGEILYIYGRTGMFLEPAAGDARLNIQAMARDGLKRPLTTALHRAVSRGVEVQSPRLKVKTNGSYTLVDLVVKCLVPQNEGEVPNLFLILMEETGEDPEGPGESADGRAGEGAAEPERIAQLEQELNLKEEYLQSTLEDLESSNQGLRSANEELHSTNEEMQSVNEELETSKEELQSINEELATVNAELQTRVADLSRLNDDMNNLLAGTGMGTVFVDRGHQITRYTPAATKVIHLIPTDLGRPLGDMASDVLDHDLEADVSAVLETLVPIDREVSTAAGAWYLMNIRPYRTLHHVIEGAVINFVDITARKAAEGELHAFQNLSASIVATVRQPMLVLDHKMVVRMANAAFYREFAVESDRTEGRKVYELGNGQWDIPELHRLLDEVIQDATTFDGYEVAHDFQGLGPRTMTLDARRISRDDGGEDLILLAIRDVTATPPSSGPSS